ncbi:hypothetical protein [Streptomyces brevispora]|uniref:Uncharacterized protein n=1 Tax=Streptomyces brevispora TaxID=887462 RepID=A0ABZ1G5T0_9ACTN|nr:hypothetical protein [Streptomyces brevispora]WSC14608.1 hypothetical protein OIE64_18380 [Streptomyces brevispora]
MLSRSTTNRYRPARSQSRVPPSERIRATADASGATPAFWRKRWVSAPQEPCSSYSILALSASNVSTAAPGRRTTAARSTVDRASRSTA